jgi:hypothetical protein
MARKKKAQGLGDTIEQITEATGIKSVVKAIAGENCGCEERKQKLNKLFPYSKKVQECLNDSDKEYLSDFFKQGFNQLSIKQQTRITEIYFNVFKIKIQPSNCGSCWRDRINELKNVYENTIIE